MIFSFEKQARGENDKQQCEGGRRNCGDDEVHGAGGLPPMMSVASAYWPSTGTGAIQGRLLIG